MNTNDNYFSVSLPSKGLVYEDINVNDIKIRPFKGKDEALLVELNPENIKKKIVTIFENILQGIQPEKLTSGDVLYLLLWEALNSYDQNYPIQLTCENCLQKTSVVCDISKINSVELPDDFKQPMAIKLSDKTIHLRLLTLQDEILSFTWSKQTGSSYLYMYALSFVDQGDTPTTIPMRMEMLENMSTTDFQLIKDFHEKYAHGPDMESPYKCSICSYEGKIVLPFRFEVLFSFSK